MNEDSKTPFEIEFLSGPRDGEVVRIDLDEAIVGREADCALSVPADTVLSRKHACLLSSGDEISIKDLDSGYGTFVNDEQVEDVCILGATDIVRAGNVEFVCRPSSGEAADTRRSDRQVASEPHTSK